MESKFTVGQSVKIISKSQLRELKQQGEDISKKMFKYGGEEAVILEPPKFYNDLLAYTLDIDENDWLWYENLLEPIE